MSFNESKQKHLLQEINNCKKRASKLISSHNLFEEENDLYISGPVISSTSGDNEFVRCEDIVNFYDKNLPCFTFKLIDNAIITLFVLSNSSGQIEKFSFAFCSCPVFQDILIEEHDNLTFDEEEFTGIENKKDYLFTKELRSYFNKRCGSDDHLIKSMIDLAKNPLYIRCDYDSTITTEQHPEYHLTVNFIKESRFKIDKAFTFYDFVVFILDIVYGKKEEHPRQYIHINI